MHDTEHPSRQSGQKQRDAKLPDSVKARRCVFRRSGQIKAVLKPFVRKKPTAFVQAVLQTAVAQIVFMEVPPHAAVGETVEVREWERSYGKVPMTKIAVQLIKDPGLDLSVAEKREDLVAATGGTPVGRQTVRLNSTQLGM